MLTWKAEHIQTKTVGCTSGSHSVYTKALRMINRIDRLSNERTRVEL